MKQEQVNDQDWEVVEDGNTEQMSGEAPTFAVIVNMMMMWLVLVVVAVIKMVVMIVWI